MKTHPTMHVHGGTNLVGIVPVLDFGGWSVHGDAESRISLFFPRVERANSDGHFYVVRHFRPAEGGPAKRCRRIEREVRGEKKRVITVVVENPKVMRIAGRPLGLVERILGLSLAILWFDLRPQVISLTCGRVQ